MQPLWKVRGSFNQTSCKVFDVRIVRYTGVLSSFSVSLSLCLSVSLSVCLSVCVSLSLCVVCCSGARGCGCVGGGGREEEGGGEEKGRETNRTIWAKVSLNIAETESFVRMIGGIRDMMFSIFSQT